MPARLPKPCSYPGCSNLTITGRCVAHPIVVVRDRQRHRLYGRAWQRKRNAYLAEHPWCEDCLAQGKHTLANEVHHEDRHAGDAEKFWNSSLRSLCKPCHSRHTIREVTSPPVKKVL